MSLARTIEQKRAEHRQRYRAKQARPRVTRERLLELLCYNEENGIFTYRIARGRFKRGDVAGTISVDLRVSINIDGRLYRAHRLAWLYMTGAWPLNEIDHRDTNPSNNAWANLRDVTPSVNKQNMRRAPTGKRSSPLLGAQWCNQAGKWMARIRVDGKRRHIGFFATDREAHDAYVRAKRELHEGCTL